MMVNPDRQTVADQERLVNQPGPVAFRVAARAAGNALGTFVWVLILLAFGYAFFKANQRPPAVAFASTFEQYPRVAAAPASGEEPKFESGFLPNPKPSQSHAASMVALSDGRVRAFWMDGEEGIPEAVISTSLFEPVTARWSEPLKVTDAPSTAADVLRHVRKIGNMVAHRSDNGTLWLFYVTVSVGGWGGSSISFRTSADDGVSWSAARRLITSPFMNFSTLLRHAPVAFADGSMGLPLYHEFLNMYSELVRIDANGKIIDRQRLNDRFVAIQPQVLVQGPTQALVLMRNSGLVRPRKVLQSSTQDSGEHWSGASESLLPNPGSPVSGVVLSDARILIARNNSDSRRKILSLAVSVDSGSKWRTIHWLEDQSRYGSIRVEPAVLIEASRKSAMAAGETEESARKMAEFAATVRCNDNGRGDCDFEFSYPFVTRSSNGDFLVAYTWNRTHLRWVRFNEAWVNQRYAESADVMAN